jgi:bifunctional non-homologous end joining protein LigD
MPTASRKSVRSIAFRSSRAGKGATKPATKSASRKPKLAEYQRKRDFKITAEPPPRLAKAEKQPIFVIQKHAATRLHWDFRLEAEGVLKSWAVTKEPTMDPTIRRLAVHVEDHPLAYANFHGDIPAGQYGAGHVDIWDSGTYTPKIALPVAKGMHVGHVEIELHGQKLKGMFALIRMGEAGAKENWLLIKMKDEFALPGSAPQEPRAGKGKKGRKSRDNSPKAEPSGSAAGSSKTATSAARRRKLAAKPLGSVPRETAGDTSPAAPEVNFTHVDKVMFPDPNITKADLIRFYVEIAPHLLPHLKDRPATLERLPDGLTSEKAPRFWQKNTPTYYPQWIPRVSLPADGGAKHIAYTLVNNEHVLAYLANQAVVTIHPFTSRTQNLHRPDYLVFDLDRGEAPFTDAVKIARKLRELLEAQDVVPFVKTSGKSGLHIMTAWKGDGGYEPARTWADGVAEAVVKELPRIATTQRSKAARGGRVYVDVGQNGPGKHIVPPYVVRATPEATVSTPLDWDEVTEKLDPGAFTMEAVLKRVKRIDPSLPLLALIGLT